MNLERWQLIGEIYQTAVDLSEPARTIYVNNSCEGDVQLRTEVCSLLQSDELSGDFLQEGVFESGLKILLDSQANTLSSAVGGPESDTLPGTTLDRRYFIEQKLGEGGVGAVYLARDRKLHDKRLVVKVLLDKALKQTLIKVKFQQEIEALARIDHPGVINIIDTGESSEGKPYIVMQYVEGISLREAIHAEPDGMPLERVAEIVQQIGAALGAVHEKQIYHRDLKPENIMLQRLPRGDEQVKILDFGVAKVKDSVVAPNVVTGGATLGTVLYMSPEQLQGVTVDAASDIYSFGVIAFEMLTGRRPLDPDSAIHLAELQAGGVYPKPTSIRTGLPSSTDKILLNSFSFDPQLRYSNAGEFGDELAAALTGRYAN